MTTTSQQATLTHHVGVIFDNDRAIYDEVGCIIRNHAERGKNARETGEALEEYVRRVTGVEALTGEPLTLEVLSTAIGLVDWTLLAEERLEELET